MHSALAVTSEIYDMDLAAAELVGQIQEALPSVQNRCAILFADPGYKWDVLLPKLTSMLEVDIVGASSAAMLSSRGYHSTCATLLLLGADDCVFGSALSPALEGHDAEQQLCQTYDRALAKLQGAQPELVIVFSSSSPDCTEDQRLRLLQKISNNIPIFGGVAADYFEFSRTTVFGEGKALAGAVSLVLIGGNVRPKFVMRNVSRKHIAKSRITSITGNVIHTIDNISAYEYMIRHDADPSSLMALQFSPLLVDTQENDEDNKHVICRPFFSLDAESGNGTIISSDIPVGTAVTVQAIQSSDIVLASRDAMDSLVEEIGKEKDKNYTYSTVLGISCAGRHMVLAFDKKREASLAQDIFPTPLTFSGFYSFGEFCPIAINRNGADNRLHNLSLGLCAM